VGELEHFARHRLLEAVDTSDTVAHVENGPNFGEVDVGLVTRQLLLQDRGDLASLDMHTGALRRTSGWRSGLREARREALEPAIEARIEDFAADRRHEPGHQARIGRGLDIDGATDRLGKTALQRSQLVGAERRGALD